MDFFLFAFSRYFYNTLFDLKQNYNGVLATFKVMKGS